MSEYVELGETHTWYEKRGQGEPLILLHPGGVDSRALGPITDALASDFMVYLPERRGHGHTPDPAGPYSFELMAGDTIQFIEQVIGKPARLVGYSDGAIVALVVAKMRPDLVDRIVCVAGVFNKAGWADGVIEPGREPPEFMVDSYAEVSPDGRDHYQIVSNKLDQMHSAGPTLTTGDLKQIACRLLVMLGDDDEVTLEHAVEFYRALPRGELAVVPGTSHGLLVEKPDLCHELLSNFLTLDPIETFAPIRRA